MSVVNVTIIVPIPAGLHTELVRVQHSGVHSIQGSIDPQPGGITTAALSQMVVDINICIPRSATQHIWLSGMD